MASYTKIVGGENKIHNKNNLDDLITNRFKDMHHRTFEDFIAELFNKDGYQVKQTPYSGDYGADIITMKNKEKTAIQVKKYRKNQEVTPEKVHPLIAGREFYNCDESIFITTSNFSKEAQVLSRYTNIELWNWNTLKQKLRETFKNKNDFSSYSLKDEFYYSIDRKFQSIDGIGFMHIIAQLFEEKGYEVKKCPYSSFNYGGTYIIKKNNQKTILEYEILDLNVSDYPHWGHRKNTPKAGVDNLYPIIGAKEFYKCNKAIFITNSVYTENAKVLAEKTNTKLWNWNRLKNEIKNLFIEKDEIPNYFKEKANLDPNDIFAGIDISHIEEDDSYDYDLPDYNY